MSIYKEIIESMERIDYAKEKQKEGKLEYLSLEKGNRDFISSIWNAVEKGIRKGQNKVIENCKELGIEISPYTEEEVKNLARETIVRGCYEEGCSKDYLKRAFGISDELLESILNKNLL